MQNKGGAPILASPRLSSPVCYLWQCGKLPSGNRKAHEGVAQTALCKKGDKDGTQCAGHQLQNYENAYEKYLQKCLKKKLG